MAKMYFSLSLTNDVTSPLARSPQPFSIAIGRKVLVQQIDQFHALHLRYQQRDVIHAFGFYAQGFFHVLQLIRILKLRPDLSEW